MFYDPVFLVFCGSPEFPVWGARSSGKGCADEEMHCPLLLRVKKTVVTLETRIREHQTSPVLDNDEKVRIQKNF